MTLEWFWVLGTWYYHGLKLIFHLSSFSASKPSFLVIFLKFLEVLCDAVFWVVLDWYLGATRS